MSGHIRQRSLGTFEVKFEIGRDPVTGRRLTKTRTVRGGKKDAQRELRRLLGHVDDGTHTDPGKLTLGDYLDQWLAGHRATVSARTAERYGEHIDNHIKPAIGGRLLGKIAREDLNIFYADKLATGRLDGTGGLSAQTVRHFDRLLHIALKDAVLSHLIPSNPSQYAKRPKVKRTPKQTLSADEFKRLLAKAKGGRLYMPVLVILATGLRRGELLALRWRNVNLDNGVLFVVEAVEETRAGIRVKEPKTDEGRRRVDLPDFAVAALREHRLAQQQERLALGLGWNVDTLAFGNPLGELQRPRNFTKSVTRLAATAGVRFTPHLGRHDHFTRLLETGVHTKIAQVRAGHSSIAVTMDIYSHATGAVQREATERMDNAFAAIQGGVGGNPVAKDPFVA